MLIERKKISALKPAPYNPRKSNPEQERQLTESLTKFGVVEPVIWNKQTGHIVGGHFRVRELKKLGHKEVDCVVVDLSPEDERELNIRLNSNTGEFDWGVLRANFDVEQVKEWGLEVPDMDVKVMEAEEDDFEVPEGGIETDIVLGDLFEIGEHRLLCGDSTDSDQVAKLMNGEKADLLLTDPPYGIGIDGQKQSKAKNPKHNRKHHEFRGWDNERPEQSTFELILSFANQGIIWGGNYFADLLPATRGWIYWSKGQDGLTMSDGELAWTSEDRPLRAVTVNRAALQGSVHPTQKPIEVMNFCIKWADKAEFILDTFTGSGSTMVAAHQLKRKCYGMELDPKYCQVIVDRMMKLDPSLQIKRNGKPYVKTDIKQTNDGIPA